MNDKCGQPCEVFSRVCGYFRPVANWNKGKKEEFRERQTFNIKNIDYHHITKGLICDISSSK